jgi:hypothetical protein
LVAVTQGEHGTFLYFSAGACRQLQTYTHPTVNRRSDEISLDEVEQIAI